MRDRRIGIAAALALLTLALAVSPAESATSRKSTKPRKTGNDSTQVYKWVDENGVTHYGDQVPPEYAAQDRTVMNQYGVAVGSEQGRVSADERAVLEREAAARKAEAEAERRDQILLDTYLSVGEIEALRDRRMELMDGQIKVTENYLGVLKGKLKELKTEAAAFRPYSSDPEAEPIDEKLAAELADTMESVALYEKTLQDTRRKRADLVAAFAADIARFRELKQIDQVQP